MEEEPKKKFVETKGFKIGTAVIGVGYEIWKVIKAENDRKLLIMSAAYRVADEVLALRAANTKEDDPTMIVAKVRATWALRDLKDTTDWPYGRRSKEELRRLEDLLDIHLEDTQSLYWYRLHYQNCCNSTNNRYIYFDLLHTPNDSQS